MSYLAPSEFLFDLRHPNRDFLNKTCPPLMELSLFLSNRLFGY